jgi:hypothetical protein
MTTGTIFLVGIGVSLLVVVYLVLLVVAAQGNAERRRD